MIVVTSFVLSVNLLSAYVISSYRLMLEVGLPATNLKSFIVIVTFSSSLLSALATY